MKGLLALAAAAIVFSSLGLDLARADQRKADVATASTYDEISSNGRRQRHRRAHYWRHGPVIPQACNSVIFPRSPLCGFAIVTFGPYYY
jgi:hypothetical protein